LAWRCRDCRSEKEVRCSRPPSSPAWVILPACRARLDDRLRIGRRFRRLPPIVSAGVVAVSSAPKRASTSHNASGHERADLHPSPAGTTGQRRPSLEPARASGAVDAERSGWSRARGRVSCRRSTCLGAKPRAAGLESFNLFASRAVAGTPSWIALPSHRREPEAL